MISGLLSCRGEPRPGVRLAPRNILADSAWPDFLDPVVSLYWIQWPGLTGIGGQVRPEYATVGVWRPGDRLAVFAACHSLAAQV